MNHHLTMIMGTGTTTKAKKQGARQRPQII